MPERYVLGEQARAALDSIILYVAEQRGSVETTFRVDEKPDDGRRTHSSIQSQGQNASPS